jgi:hypothetical protein
VTTTTASFKVPIYSSLSATFPDNFPIAPKSSDR